MFYFLINAAKETMEFYTAYNELNNLSDNELRELGINRNEILFEIQKSFANKYVC